MKISTFFKKKMILYMYYSDFGDLKIYVSHGSVATELKLGEIFNNYFIANCPQYVPVKKF